MADFTGLINQLVGVANTITASLQAQVTHAPLAKTSPGHDGQPIYTRDGQPTYKTAVKRTAIVEKRQDQVRALDGTQKVSHTRLTFLSPFALDPRDKLTLPDGSSPAILAVKGPLGSDGVPFVLEVWF
jgi:hypothetical protein